MTADNPDNRYFHLARFTLEARTALSIGSGSPDGVFDTALVRDANGLPTIPGTTLAGVLRHLLRTETDEETADRLFGAEGRGQRHADGQASRLLVAWGVILDSAGVPVEGLALGQAADALLEDKILGPLLRQREVPLVRNRVRIGHRGAASDTGKFDRALLPPGYRFACELALFDPLPEPAVWALLLGLLADPRLRLGGATRAGLGRASLVSLAAGSFDLQDPDRAAAFRALGRGIGDTAGLIRQRVNERERDLPPGWVALDLDLSARDFWRIGQGNASLRRRDPQRSDEKESDALPVLEPRVVWTTPDRAEPSAALPLAPGSAIKGALAHRAEYYANCAEPADSPRWADNRPDGPDGADGLDKWDRPAGRDSACDRRHPAIVALFGHSKEQAEGDGPTGRAGRVFIDDVQIPLAAVQVGKLTHNAIDRFTGGVRERLLFGEDLLWRTPVKVRVLVDTRPAETEKREDLERGLDALRRAIEDLAAGRLALGASAGRGHGYFVGNRPDGLDRLTARETTV